VLRGVVSVGQRRRGFHRRRLVQRRDLEHLFERYGVDHFLERDPECDLVGRSRNHP
jgi:hypothetical protein